MQINLIRTITSVPSKNINIISSLAINSLAFNSPDFYLSLSIFLETTSTICLRNVVKNKLWYIPSYIGYGISFYLFPKSFSKYSLSKAYTIWCGSGILLTTFADSILFAQVLTLKKLLATIIMIFAINLIK